MRRVFIKGTPPQDWIDDADAVTERLRAAATEDERVEIIREREHLWRDDRIRDWLLQQFADKCWYTEARDSVSSIHIDHYRPKGRAKDLEGNECEGYWWLAFDWKNYRICGQLINVKKLDVFPLVEGARATLDPISLQLEAPVLIDPISDQTRLVSYERDEDACLAVAAAGVTEVEERRAKDSIDVLGLNRRARLNRKRAEFWDRCRMAIADYEGADGPQVLRLVSQASAVKTLKEMVAYTAEFSSVAEACIRKHAPMPVVATVFEQNP
ncbi:MAG: hypothetical protein QOH06_2050 [Acidobacteriota bacterium]|jgi:hypothetical protein|nr:hypothetical protein [Acidobacteriota bacterium]